MPNFTLDTMNSEAPMSDEEFIDDRRRGLKESIEYFSAKNKAERERWVCLELVQNLGIAYDEAEIVSPKNDPPDVVFRDARFEIKEILDLGRKRHAEYKAALQKALTITDPQDLLDQYTPKDITPVQIGERVQAELRGLKHHYPRAVCEGTDLLFYVNLQEHHLKIGLMPVASDFGSFGWRSISAVLGWGALVFFAAPNAPAFLCAKAGTATLRKFK
ncbi:MAG: DUF1780 domain-containing protein [Thiobacillus sp.]